MTSIGDVAGSSTLSNYIYLVKPSEFGESDRTCTLSIIDVEVVCSIGERKV